MTNGSPDDREQRRERAIGVAFALAGSTMFAASLLFAQVVLRARASAGMPAHARPAIAIAVLITVAQVVGSVALTSAESRRASLLLATVASMASAAVAAIGGHLAFHRIGRDSFDVITSALLAWHAAHALATAVACASDWRAGTAPRATTRVLAPHTSLVWLVIVGALWWV